MPCGGDDVDDDDIGDVWWNRIEPIEKPDDPNSFMSKFSDVLGNSIDTISDLIVTAAILLSAMPVHLLVRVTGYDPAQNATARFD